MWPVAPGDEASEVRNGSASAEEAAAVGAWISGTTTAAGGVGRTAGAAVVRESNAHRFFRGSWWTDRSAGAATDGAGTTWLARRR